MNSVPSNCAVNGTWWKQLSNTRKGWMNRKRRKGKHPPEWLVAAALAAGALCLQGCSSLTAGHAITDAALGAGGAGIGYAIDGAKGAAIGAGAGLLFGEGVNYFADRKVRDAREYGYVLGRSDEAKNLYWAQRNFVNTRKGETALRRKLVEVPIPAHYDRDGQYIDASWRVIEVVE